jgi:hypothetical protein
MKRVLQGGLSFVFCKRKLEYLIRIPFKKISNENNEPVITVDRRQT